jgi:hypothetical protein
MYYEDYMMRADSPIPPNVMNSAAPEGTPPRRSAYSFYEHDSQKNALPSEARTRRPSDPIKGGLHYTWRSITDLIHRK